MAKIKDISGQKFGRLTAKHVAGIYEKSKITIWHCECECGNTKDVMRTSLIRGGTTSCGCYNQERIFGGYEEIGLTYWNNLVNGASRRGYVFDLDIVYGWNLYLEQNRKCAISGIHIRFASRYDRMKNDIENLASLDRIDNSIGYVRGNVQWVHKEINRMRGSLSLEEFISFCSIIRKNNNETTL